MRRGRARRASSPRAAAGSQARSGCRTSACRSTIRWSRAFSSATTACAASDAAASTWSASKIGAVITSVPEVGRAGAERERDALARRLGIADRGRARRRGRARAAVGAGRLDRRSRRSPAGAASSRGSRRAPRRDAGGRVADAGPLGLELDEPLLELRRHVVERAAEVGELVAAAHFDPFARDARSRVALAASDEAAQRPTIDVPSRYVTIADQGERAGEHEQDAPLGLARSGVDRATGARVRRTTSPCGSESGAVASARKDAAATCTRVGRTASAAQAAAPCPRPAITRPPRRATSRPRARATRRAVRAGASSTGTRTETRPSSVPPSVTVTERTPAGATVEPTCSPRPVTAAPARARRPGATSPTSRPRSARCSRGSAGELRGLGRGRVEPALVAGDGRAQRGLQACVDPARLAALRERVVAVERDRQAAGARAGRTRGRA